MFEYFYTHLYIDIDIEIQIYTDVFACSIVCEHRYCHSALGVGAAFLHVALRVKISIVILLFFFKDTKTHLH